MRRGKRWRDSWLRPLACRVRDWLDRYIEDDPALAEWQEKVEGETPAPDSIQSAGMYAAAASILQAEADARKDWEERVRQSAPELLVPPEEGGTPWQWAVQDASRDVRLATAAEERKKPAPAIPRPPGVESNARSKNTQHDGALNHQAKPAAPAAAPRRPTTSFRGDNTVTAKVSEQAERRLRLHPAPTQTEARHSLGSSRLAGKDGAVKKLDPKVPAHPVAGSALSKLQELGRAAGHLLGLATSSPRSATTPPLDEQKRAASSSLREGREKGRNRHFYHEHIAPFALGNKTLQRSRVADERGRRAHHSIVEHPAPVVPAASFVNHIETPKREAIDSARTRHTWPQIETSGSTFEGRRMVNGDLHIQPTPLRKHDGRAFDEADAGFWPELPEEVQSNNTDGMQALRGREHLAALDVEQRGGY